MTGTVVTSMNSICCAWQPKGVFFEQEYTSKYNNGAAGSGTRYTHTLAFYPNKVVPTGNFNTPRAFGTLACVYLGS